MVVLAPWFCAIQRRTSGNGLPPQLTDPRLRPREVVEPGSCPWTLCGTARDDAEEMLRGLRLWLTVE